MRSARSEPEPLPAAASFVRAPLQRLNVRLVLVLAAVALVALVVSGVALSQVLPPYFLDQARLRASSAAVSTALLIRTRAREIRDTAPAILTTRELLNTRLLQPYAELAANSLAQATIDVSYADGSPAAHAEPDSPTEQQLR